MNKYIHKAISILPLKKSFYEICTLYSNKYNSENNCDMKTNGEYQFIKNNLKNCNVVFDVGANIGEWTTEALNINPKLHIHCFEPSSYTFKKLQQNKFNKNVLCNNFGLSSKATTQELHIFEEGAGINSLYKRHGLETSFNLETQSKSEQIKLTTLDKYCKTNTVEKIDFLKIDVEGHELEVFKGGKNLIQQEKIKMIQFEYGGCNIDAKVLLKDIFDFFKNTNYNFYKIYPKHLKLIKMYDQKLENFQYQNWVIIHKNYALNS